MSKTLIVIPARMDSKRLPGKPLIDIAGKTLLQRTYEQASLVGNSEEIEVVVATPDQVIADHCRQIDMRSMLTLRECSSGTHRCAEVLETFVDHFDCVVNWQCDEPCVEPTDVRKLINLIEGEAYIATLIARITDEERQDPNVVKAVWLSSPYSNCCRWFSRAPMAGAYGHIGVYAFEPSTLRDLSTVAQGRYAKLESLEQLSWLFRYEIESAFALKMPISVNTPEDVQKLEKEFSGEVASQCSDQNDFECGDRAEVGG